MRIDSTPPPVAPNSTAFRCYNEAASPPPEPAFDSQPCSCRLALYGVCLGTTLGNAWFRVSPASCVPPIAKSSQPTAPFPIDTQPPYAMKRMAELPGRPMDAGPSPRRLSRTGSLISCLIAPGFLSQQNRSQVITSTCAAPPGAAQSHAGLAAMVFPGCDHFNQLRTRPNCLISPPHRRPGRRATDQLASATKWCKQQFPVEMEFAPRCIGRHQATARLRPPKIIL